MVPDRMKQDWCQRAPQAASGLRPRPGFVSTIVSSIPPAVHNLRRTGLIEIGQIEELASVAGNDALAPMLHSGELVQDAQPVMLDATQTLYRLP